ncbi:MAG: hypothetical protein JWL98_1728, partial [Xanthomonadaceae bacterium]|nr:hypothetical protein [Xanthomonadaceae bacterium]
MVESIGWRQQLQQELPAAVLTAVAFFALSASTTLFSWQTDNVSSLRMGGALLLGVMLRRRPRAIQAGLYLLLGVIAMTIVQAVAGRAWPTAVQLSAARLLELGIAYALLRGLGEDGSALQELPKLGRLMLITVFIAPLVGVSLGAWIAHRNLGADYLDAAKAWWVGNAFGMVVLLPLVLAATRERLARLLTPRRRRELALIAVLTILVCVCSVLWTSDPFVLILLPLLLAAFRLGVLGTTLLGFMASLTVLLLGRYPLLHSGSLMTYGSERLSFTEIAF